MESKRREVDRALEDVAIVGMAVNVPGAGTIEAFWRNLRDGVSSIRKLSEQELLAAGETPERIARRNYVRAAADLDGFETFDAEFFGFSPKDAAIMDPQHRKFLEVAWEAMEQAGHVPENVKEPIGVYAGCGMGSYFYFNICSNPDLVNDTGMFLLRHTGNDKDFLSTRVSHVFDLKGPSVNLQTACSTSLVAIHYAAAALRSGEVGMALAGGVTIELPQGRGYEFKENEILSPDGECHAFDHRAQGTVFGSGAGCVALKRLSDAQRDGDHIWAVIKGSAINNDGAAKAGYLAPSVDGQAAAIGQALKVAKVPAEQIELVECHGTGTYLGDPIEVAALTDAYRTQTQATDFCRIGSVKTNIGHLDTAAGVAGLVKATLALHHEAMPPSLGYEAPNPAIGFAGSPFAVNDRLTPWPRRQTPRHAAINALGVGGTNAHMILAEAPAPVASEESDFPFQPLVISGRTRAALDANTAALAAHLRAHPEQDLADIAHTLKNGRRGFERRRVVVAETHEDAAAQLEAADPRCVFTHEVLGDAPEVVFMFPGGGAQYPGMARDLYETEPVFAEAMDRGLDHLAPQLDYDIRALWLPEGGEVAAAETLKKPSVQLPLIAITEYALAQLWMSWGVRPAAMVGHSMGENVAACLAGVMPFENLIDLVLLRGRLFDSVPAGGMLSVPLSLDAVTPYVGDALDIASVNGPELTAISGPDAALTELAARLGADGIDSQRIAIDIAAHSRMLEPILDAYRDFLKTLDLQAPRIPFWSNRTGVQITAAQAVDPDYWVGQLRGTVRFADCIDSLSAGDRRIFLEVGPGKALSSLAQMAPQVAAGQVLSSLRHPDQDIPDDMYFVGVFARLWACGIDADWDQLWGEARRNRVPLPTYQFQRSRYFIEPAQAADVAAAPALSRIEGITDWGSVPSWRATYADIDADLPAALDRTAGQNWLIFADTCGIASPVIDRLRAAGARVSVVRAGDAFADLGDGAYTLAPEQGADGYSALLASLKETEALPDRIAHFWLVTQSEDDFRAGSNFFERNVEQGFMSLLWLGQALAARDKAEAMHLTVITSGAAQVTDEPLMHPEKAMISGPAGVMPREIEGLTVSTLDLRLPQAVSARGFFARAAPQPDDVLTLPVLEELLAVPANTTAALRDAKRFERRVRATPLSEADTPAFKRGGTYLITGGFGGIGQTIAADLMQRYEARVVLLSRTPMPAREAWARILSSRPASDPTARRIRAVEGLEAIGTGIVEVRCGDVVNLAQMRKVTESLRAEGLDGVVHAAGTLDDAPLLGKTQAQVDAVLAPKVQGLRVLDHLLPDGSVDLMVLFASTSTAVRAAGQVDYVAANDYLNAFAQARRGGKSRVVAVNWGVWSDVGMAAEATGRAAVEALPPRPVDLPMLDTVQPRENEIRFATSLSSADWMFDQHRTADGRAVMPGTGMVEALAEAARIAGAADGFTVEDLYFLRPLLAPEGVLRDLRVNLRRDAGEFVATLQSDCTLEGRCGWQTHVEARVIPTATQMPPPLDLDAIAAGLEAPERSAIHLATPQEAHLRFGPQWQVLRERRLGAGEGLARLTLDGGVDGHLVHPGLMDLATGWAVGLAPGYDAGDLWVPVSFGRITVHAPLTHDIFSHVRLAGDAREARFDVTICDAGGRVLVEVQDFAMTRLVGGFAEQVAPLTTAEITFDDDGPENRPKTEAEERLAYTVAQGITAAEGPRALERALAAGESQIYVSSLPLGALIAQADVPPKPAAKGQSFERTDLDGFVAPEGAVQEKLAEMWTRLLGVSPVGARDSFFDLGGHSLIAVRLFAAVKREFGVEFALSVLFEAPTIADIAARITAQVGETAETSDTASRTPHFEHLVPLNGVKADAATPLFVVAGMFGNVLNLRHLAQQFSDTRAVYGLQARGLIGDSAPHETIPEAATAYIDELRRIQPTGPYLLSGFSGGGITAYEMARQLKDAGEDVATLALLDTPLPVRPSLNRRDKMLIKLTELREKGPRYLREWAASRLAWEIEKRRGKEDGTAPVGFNNTRIEAAFLRAVGQYQTPHWGGPMTLFRPPLDRRFAVSGGNHVSTAREYVFHDNQWARYAPQVQVVEVPGDHDSMVLSPNVVVLASELREIIARALESTGTDIATAAE